MAPTLTLEVDVSGEALRPYQQEGVSFLFRNSAALLADEMGLGKTIQAIIALRFLLRKPNIDRALIVVPASLGLNWQRELERWAPELVVRRLIGSQTNRLAYYELPIAVLIATYEQISVDALDRVPDGTFDIVILDEAQRIKNYAARTAFACRLLPRSIAWALTGTPIENSRSDLESIFAFLRPGLVQPTDGESETVIINLAAFPAPAQSRSPCRPATDHLSGYRLGVGGRPTHRVQRGLASGFNGLPPGAASDSSA